MTASTLRQGEVLSYSVDGAAKALGVSKATVWRKIAEAELETFKLGARTLIPADSLQAFVDRCRGRQPTPPSARAA